MQTKRKKITLSLLQIDTERQGDAGMPRVLKTLRETVREQRGIVVLPEIWSGGFSWPEIKATARKTPEIIKELCRITRDHPSLIIGSLPESKEGRLYNTALLIEDGRIIGRYVKQHLFSPMEEDRYFATRRSRKAFATQYGKIGLAICFDLRFPEAFIPLCKEGVWLIIVPAQWPKPRCSHWEALLVARAIENQAFVAGCNRVGRTGNTSFCGGSMIVDPWGKVIARGKGKSVIVSAAVQPDRTEEIRRILPMG